MPNELACQRVNHLIQEFDACLVEFERTHIFTGPSVYFHRKVLAERARYPRLQEALQSDLLYDYLYATLASWGMHRMGNNFAKLCEMDALRNSIQAQARHIAELQKLALTDIPADKLEVAAQKIWEIIRNLTVGIGKTKIVSGSKALHHLLPNLVPPVDREYTLQFFFGHKNINRREFVLFKEIYILYRTIAVQKYNAIHQAVERGGEMNTSLTKVIDNAIVGYVLKYLKQPPQEHGLMPVQPVPAPVLPPKPQAGEPHAAQILRAAKELQAAGQPTFSRNDIRLHLGLTAKEWHQGYTAIFQGMRIDQPGGAPKVAIPYRNVFRQVEHGLYELVK